MVSAVDIRPTVAPMPLVEALSGVDVTTCYTSAGVACALADLPPIEVSGVTVSSTDCDGGWIFVAIAGLAHHGVRFAQAAKDAGATVLLTDAQGARQAVADGLALPIIEVKDPRAAAGRVAVNVYRSPAEHLKTLAITGTNGKTTTSFLMRAALRVAYPDASLCGTIETRVGSIRFLSERTTAEAPIIQRFLASSVQQDLGAAVVETSSHAMSLNRVDGIVFDVAGFTNLQHDHLDYYGDMEAYFQAKKQLFTPEHSRLGVVCVDDEWGQRLAREATVPVVTLAALSANAAEWHTENIHPDPEIGRTVFTLCAPDGRSYDVTMPLLGDVNVQNTCVAIVAVASLGYEVSDVINAVESAEQIPGRMQMVNPTPDSEPLIIVDYAHTPEALEWTLRSVRRMTRGRLHVVFGTDGDRDPSKREGLGAVAAREADVLWVTDENPRMEDPQSIRDFLMRGIAQVRPDFTDVTEVKTCRRDAVREAIFAADTGDIVIATGKGPEWYQDIRGVKHAYNDAEVALEVLHYDPRSTL